MRSSCWSPRKSQPLSLTLLLKPHTKQYESDRICSRCGRPSCHISKALARWMLFIWATPQFGQDSLVPAMRNKLLNARSFLPALLGCLQLTSWHALGWATYFDRVCSVDWPHFRRNLIVRRFCAGWWPCSETCSPDAKQLQQHSCFWLGHTIYKVWAEQPDNQQHKNSLVLVWALEKAILIFLQVYSTQIKEIWKMIRVRGKSRFLIYQEQVSLSPLKDPPLTGITCATHSFLLALHILERQRYSSPAHTSCNVTQTPGDMKMERGWPLVSLDLCVFLTPVLKIHTPKSFHSQEVSVDRSGQAKTSHLSWVMNKGKAEGC